MNIQTVSLKEYSSLRIGGSGKLVVVHNEEDLKEAIMYAKTEGLRVHFLGGGTNTYFAEDVSQYLFIKLTFTGIVFEGESVTACASEIWDDLVQACVERKLWGIENLSLIPGTVGAAPIQNIGAYGVELKDVLDSVAVFDTHTMKTNIFTNEMCTFGYRTSLFKEEKDRYVVLSIVLKLSLEPKPVLTYKPLDALQGKEVSIGDVRNLVVATRQAKLPDWEKYPNAGSFFKNPTVTLGEGEALRGTYPDIVLHEVESGYKIPAAWLIEHVAEMKGERRGDVGTWPNQPLVVVNYGSGTPKELASFTKEIRDKVFEKTGIRLEQEVNSIG